MAYAKANPADRSLGRGARGVVSFHRQDGSQDSKRNARRQRLVDHLHQCGPRPVLEALISVAAGDDLDDVLADFGRLPSEIYRGIGADVLPIDIMTVLNGGRS